MSQTPTKKVLLAFSGGLDTSYCARYLAVEQGYDVHTVIVNTGGFTPEELEAIARRARSCMVASHTVLDRTHELYTGVLRYLIAGNVLKNNRYPLSVSAERIVQAIAIAEYATMHGFDAVAHGSTGAGNDQFRFDMILRTLCPQAAVITPIRDQQLSREQEIAYLREHGVEGDWTRAAYSINQGIWGTTIGGKETLTSDQPLPDDAFPSSVYDVPDEPMHITIGFVRGEPVSINGAMMDPVEVIQHLNHAGALYHVGREMHVGDTILGIKGRVAFEAPAPMIVINAHHQLEKHVLSKWQLQLKDQLALWYGQLLHEAQFLDPAARSIEAFFADTQRYVTGEVDLELHPERMRILGVRSPFDLMAGGFGAYGEEHGAWTGQDAQGYAAIASIAARLYHHVHSSSERASGRGES